MSPSSIFGTQLPVSKTLFLIWIILSLIHGQTGIVFSLDAISPIEFGLKAGLLFGYYTFFYAVASYGFKLVALFVFYAIKGFDSYEVERLLGESKDRMGEDKLKTRAGIKQRLLEVLTMFAAFYLYSEPLFQIVSPIGLALAIVLYITGAYSLGA